MMFNFWTTLLKILLLHIALVIALYCCFFLLNYSDLFEREIRYPWSVAIIPIAGHFIYSLFLFIKQENVLRNGKEYEKSSDTRRMLERKKN